MRIFAAGILTETNTFSQIPTTVNDFLVSRGGEVRVGAVHPGLDVPLTWGELAKARDDEFVLGIMAWAQPSGVTVRFAYESLRDELLGDLRAALPLDVVLLNLHGAMVAEGYEDCEEDLIRRVRSIVGPAVVVGVELDLHCHLTPSKIAESDVVVTYKEYPHVDIKERAKELFDLVIASKLGTIRPTMALFDCRMIGMYPTSRQPLRKFVDAMMEAERREGVLSISFGHGFQFADLEHVGARVLAVTNHDQALAARIAREFGLRAHELRREIGFDSLSLDQALSIAVAEKDTPVVVADQSDNPGAGAPGDATYALRWLLEHEANDVAIAMVYDPEVVKSVQQAGQGAQLSVTLGGKLGPFSGNPVDIEVSVLSVIRDYMHEFPQRSGKNEFRRAGDVVAIRRGSIDIVVSSVRCQCFAPSIFSDLGIDPNGKRILVVKSTQHFYGAFAPIAAKVIYMAGPGAVVPDPKHLPYRRLDTSRLYPWADQPLPEMLC